MGGIIEDLLRAVERFSAWADTVAVTARTGEWESDYPNWSELRTAFTSYVSTTSAEDWDYGVQTLLLYVIARDNETGETIALLRTRPDELLCLARAALPSSERDAKWQMAEHLGHLASHRQEAENLLAGFAADEDEYVRRRALMALGQLHSPLVEMFADEFWQTADEYAQMAVLNALQSVDSRLLPSYLNRAEVDERPYLRAEADRIRGSIKP